MNRGEELITRLACASDEGLSSDDFLALALAAIDQAGVRVNVQRVVAKALDVDICKRCQGAVPNEPRAEDDQHALDHGYCSHACWLEEQEAREDIENERRVDEHLEARKGL